MQIGSVPYGDFLPLFLSPFFAALLLIRAHLVRNDSHYALISVCVPLLSFSFGGSKPLFGGGKLSFARAKLSFGGSKPSACEASAARVWSSGEDYVSLRRFI
mgnify:CR=1 FL=1